MSSIDSFTAALDGLKQGYETGRLAHAYLVVGSPRGNALAFSESFIQFLFCRDKNRPCGKCPECDRVKRHEHPDVLWLQPETKSRRIDIEQIREELTPRISRTSYGGGYKVGVILYADRLTEGAANAFLKTLEEPPRDSLIILVTDRPSLLLPTVLSRCRIVKFYPMRRNVLRDTLMARAYGGAPVTAVEAHFLAYFSEGSLGVSLKLKSQGLFAQKNRIIDIYCSIGAQTDDPVSCASRMDLLSSFNILVSWFRDIYMLKNGVPQGELIHADRLDELELLAGSYSFQELDRILRLLSDSVLDVGRNLNKKLLVSNVIVSCKQSHSALA